MTISFFEPGDVPQPPEKVKIEHLATSIYEDRWRVKVVVHVTPFQVRPSLAMVVLTNEEEEMQVVSELTIIETMHAKMEFTLHIRNVADPAGEYVLKIRLYYGEDIHTPFDEKQHAFSIPELDEGSV